MLSINKIEKAPGIWVYNNAFDSQDFCSQVEEQSSMEWPYLEWHSSQTGDGENTATSEYRSSLEMSLNVLYGSDVNESLQELKTLFIENILKPVDQCVWDYRN